MLMKNWKVMLIVAIHCLIYFDDDLVFLSSAAADPNRTLADDRVAKGFISIDCGMSGDSRYDNNAGLHYTSDEHFINTGIKYNVQPQFYNKSLWPVYNTLRSFPEGERNCYTLKPKQGKNCSYLIRVYFLYGNYDGKSSFPRFHLFIDVNFLKEVEPFISWNKSFSYVNLWEEVEESGFGRSFFYELIYTPPRDYIHICLVNIEKGAPFISGLELKPLNTTTSIYKSTTGALAVSSRFDTGSTSTLNDFPRKDDPYDREWGVVPQSSAVWGTLRSDESMMKTTAIITENAYKLPPSVLKTAAIPVHDDTGSLDFYYNNTSRQYSVYQVYWHFAEIQKLRINDSREFTISFNGKSLPGKISPIYMEASTIVSPETTIDGNNSIVFNITRTPKSTLPPILNALEIYSVLHLPKSATNQDDVNAIMNIKKHYAMGKAWQGDPCRPAPVWNGLNCSEDDDNHSPRITSLNLVAKGLEGDIPGSLSNLTSLTHLNLSYNNLTGVIPDFLADLPSLQTLDLKSNNLTGRVPTALSKKVEQGTLQLSLEDNPDLCTSSSCYKKNWKKIGAILAAALVSITLIVTAIAAVYKYKHKKQENSRGNVGFDINNNVEEEYELPIYDFYVVAQATNHFSKSNKVGEGGFGPVYKGVLSDGQEIAVKRLSKESRQGLNEFKNEVIFIAKLQHRNLVKLVGCSIEAEERLLIYEYMPNKSLDCYIFAKPTSSREILDWPKRLEIINGIARGLLYLHQDSRLRIVHRDLKANNILLDSEMNAKISDFGLARSFNGNEDEALTKRVVGTYGYMPPEYAIDGFFSVKSDLFSFGVIILEIISGEKNRGFIRSDHHHTLLGHAWMLFKEGVPLEVANQQIRNDKYASEMVRLIHIGLLCVQQHPKDRPNMALVSAMLNSDSTLPQPKEPGFYARRNFPQESEASTSKSSNNYVSVTCLSGR